MQIADDKRPSWPALNYPDWRDTAATVQLWTQIVGKVRLALSPWLNHGWQVPLYVNAHGLGTGAIRLTVSSHHRASCAGAAVRHDVMSRIGKPACGPGRLAFRR